MHSFIPSTIRRYRNQRRLTLENVSGIAGMSVQHLSEIESSKRAPRLSSIERIADAQAASAISRACCAPKSCCSSFRASWRFKTSSPIGCGALKCATNPLTCAKKLTGRVLPSRPALKARFHGRREPFTLRSSYFVNELTDDLSIVMVKRIQNRFGVEIWPWERAGFTRAE